MEEKKSNDFENEVRAAMSQQSATISDLVIRLTVLERLLQAKGTFTEEEHQACLKSAMEELAGKIKEYIKGREDVNKT